MISWGWGRSQAEGAALSHTYRVPAERDADLGVFWSGCSPAPLGECQRPYEDTQLRAPIPGAYYRHRPKTYRKPSGKYRTVCTQTDYLQPMHRVRLLLLPMPKDPRFTYGLINTPS